MTPPVALTFDNLTRLANTLDDNTSIVVKNGGFETRGKVGSFFTLKSTNRHAGNVLFAAVRQMYGNTVADALAPQMRAARVEGKPLSARMVRDVLASAAEMHQGLARVNEDMVRRFVAGSGVPGDTRNLDAAFANFCASKNIDPAAHQNLKNAFGEAVRDHVKADTTKLFSYEELCNLVSTAGTKALQEAWNAAEADAFMRDATNGAAAATDACAAGLGVPDGQKQELAKIVDMAVHHEAAMAAEKGVPFDKAALFRNIAAGTLPELQAFAFACGKGGQNLNYIARDCMAWASPDKAAEFAMLTSQLNHAGMACIALAAQRLDVMRTMQPAGMLTRETLWQGCFGEPLPANVGQDTEAKFNDAMFNRLGEIFRQAQPTRGGMAEMGMTFLATGITLNKAVESLRGPVSLVMGDFINIPTLTPLPRLGTLQEVEASLAKDINRRGTHSPLPGYMPTVSFAAPGVEAHAVRIRDTAGMSEDDKRAFEKGEPSTISAELARRAVELCNGNDVQARQVIQSMGQSGAFLVRTNSPVTGIAESEHSPLDIDIRREENGNVTMRFHKPDNSPLDVDYTYTITPDGRGVLTACRIQARAAAQPAAAE